MAKKRTIFLAIGVLYNNLYKISIENLIVINLLLINLSKIRAFILDIPMFVYIGIMSRRVQQQMQS